MSEESATGIDVPTKGRFLLEIEVEGPAMSVSEFGLTLSKQWIDYAGPLRLVACHGARAAGAAEPDANAALAMSQANLADLVADRVIGRLMDAPLRAPEGTAKPGERFRAMVRTLGATLTQMQVAAASEGTSVIEEMDALVERIRVLEAERKAPPPQPVVEVAPKPTLVPSEKVRDTAPRGPRIVPTLARDIPLEAARAPVRRVAPVVKLSEPIRLPPAPVTLRRIPPPDLDKVDGVTWVQIEALGCERAFIHTMRERGKLVDSGDHNEHGLPLYTSKSVKQVMADFPSMFRPAGRGA